MSDEIAQAPKEDLVHLNPVREDIPSSHLQTGSSETTESYGAFVKTISTYVTELADDTYRHSAISELEVPQYHSLDVSTPLYTNTMGTTHLRGVTYQHC